MPDWDQIVGQRLGRMKLAPEERREVIAEVAGHLEDCYQELCAAGSPDPEGYALAQVPDWKALGRRIQKAKEDPMSFPRKVLIPGLMALFLALAVQVAIFHLLVRMPGAPWAWQFRWTGEYTSLGVFYVPWLLTLPLAGALGAWMARRAGGSVRQRLTAALFPMLYTLALALFVVPFFLLTEPNRVLSIALTKYAAGLIVWGVIPGIACGIGALPLLSAAPQQAEQTPPTQAANA